MKVSLFIPCLTEHMFPESAISMVKVFEHLDLSVEYVENQTCCGQPAFNSGYHKEALPAAERFIELFRDKEYIVAPSGSCVAMVRVFYKQLKLKQESLPGLQELCGKIYEFSEFLVDVMGITNVGGSFAHRVTYHDSCHLNRELGVNSQPRQLISNIKNIDFIEMNQSDACCGFGGTFSCKHSNISVEMVKRKCEHIIESSAEFCIGADSSCLMNIASYLRKQGHEVKTKHIADLIAESLNL